jgi:hypothetical protein
MKAKKLLLVNSVCSLLALGLTTQVALAQTVSASGPLSGNYVGTSSGGCSPGYPAAVGDVINWMTTNNAVSQSTFIPEPSLSYSNWLAGITLSAQPPFNTVFTPGPGETVLQWGVVNRSVVYGSNSSVGTFDTVVPPKLPDVAYNQNQQFILTSYTYTFPLGSGTGSGTGYYLYFYVPLFTNFFKYGVVLNQSTSLATSATGVFQGNLGGCTFIITYNK